jgi:disulfide bond formation protein DsbB
MSDEREAPAGSAWSARLLAVVSLLLTAAGTAGSLYLSLGMGLKACPLCFYQRTFVMAAAGVLAAVLWIEPRRAGLACLLALPAVWGGLGVAAFHEYLVLAGTLECPPALFGVGTAPAQSLATFAVLAACATSGAWLGRGESPRQGPREVVALVVLGGLLAWGCVASAPPLPDSPNEPYDPLTQPLDTCRRPFQGP